MSNRTSTPFGTKSAADNLCSIGVMIFLKLKSIRAFLSMTVVLYVMLVVSADRNDAGMPTALAISVARY